MIPRYAQDFGSRYAPDYRPARTERATRQTSTERATRHTTGRATRWAAGRAARRTNCCVTTLLDFRASGRMTRMHNHGHGGFAPRSDGCGLGAARACSQTDKLALLKSQWGQGSCEVGRALFAPQRV